jgi:acetyl-CoA carboxylase carboxyltransferase component
MLEIIKLVVDDGKILELKPKWARSIITGLARLGGRPVGIVASNPRHLGGILANDSADKAARFIQICDAFNLPLVFLMDVPGFMVGSQVEHAGIIRHGAKMLHAMASATVAKHTVVVRKGYGAGYYVMAGRAYEPDLLVAWPGAEISVMGAEGMVGIAGKKLFGDQEPPPEVKQQMVQMLQAQIDIYRVAGWGLVDDVIDPRDTRGVLCRAVEMAWNRKVERPYRKHGIMPCRSAHVRIHRRAPHGAPDGSASGIESKLQPATPRSTATSFCPTTSCANFGKSFGIPDMVRSGLRAHVVARGEEGRRR